MTTSELDGMAVDLARFEGSACQDLEVHVNFMWIPAQAVEQVIQFRMTPIFITGLQGWESWPGTGNFMHLSFLSASFLLSHSHPLIWGEQRKKTSGISIADVLGYLEENADLGNSVLLVLLLLKIFQPSVPRKSKLLVELCAMQGSLHMSKIAVKFWFLYSRIYHYEWLGSCFMY